VEQILAVVVAALGLGVVGPFLNVIVERVPSRLPLRGSPAPSEPVEPMVVAGVPLQPYLIRRGRGPDGERLPRRWLWCELVTATLFALAALEYGDTTVVIPVLVLFAALVPASIIDLLLLRIPDRVVFPALGLAAIAVVAVSVFEEQPGAITGALVGATTYFVFLFVPHLIYPKGMGFGDVKLALLLGLVVGWLGWVSNDAVLGPIRLVIYAMLAGLLAGVLFGVLLPMIRRGRAFPLGPGLAIGAVLVVLRASELTI
jgi:leader peptidase (prepilin peptidase)/N-methyltransferase